MSVLRLWRDPFESKLWDESFTNVIDRFFDVPNFIEKGHSHIVTTDENYKIQLSVPGLTKKDVKIGVDDSVITISHVKEQTDDKTFYFTSSFRKEYSLPSDCDEEKISSKLENGILEVVIPRKKKKDNERFVEIN